jgi:NTP pyrophosphatase (non-canonical NTP hydrolase)
MTRSPASSRALSFAALRTANRARVPQFKNKLGGRAHSSDDGSDWNPAQWLQALVGEVGEYARVRHLYETGQLSYEAFQVEAKKELADVQCYLDLLSMRALDKTRNAASGPDFAQELQQLMAGLGEYANWRKKLERGDIDAKTFSAVSAAGLAEAREKLAGLSGSDSREAAVVVEAHPSGVDLGEAAHDKFNEVSVRVGATVFLVNGQAAIG